MTVVLGGVLRVFAVLPFTCGMYAVHETKFSANDGSAYFLFAVAVVLWTAGDVILASDDK